MCPFVVPFLCFWQVLVQVEKKGEFKKDFVVKAEAVVEAVVEVEVKSGVEVEAVAGAQLVYSLAGVDFGQSPGVQL